MWPSRSAHLEVSKKQGEANRNRKGGREERWEGERDGGKGQRKRERLSSISLVSFVCGMTAYKFRVGFLYPSKETPAWSNIQHTKLTC